MTIIIPNWFLIAVVIYFGAPFALWLLAFLFGRDDLGKPFWGFRVLGVVVGILGIVALGLALLGGFAWLVFSGDLQRWLHTPVVEHVLAWVGGLLIAFIAAIVVYDTLRRWFYPARWRADRFRQAVQLFQEAKPTDSAEEQKRVAELGMALAKDLGLSYEELVARVKEHLAGQGVA